MNKATLLTLPCLLTTLLVPVLSYGEDFLLYTPKPAEKEQVPASPGEGILVRSITVKRGDTLSNISHKYIGRASWYPQVLLFNSIEDPDLIYTGDKLLVPVPSEQAAATVKTLEKKHLKGEKRHGVRHRAAARHKAVTKPEAAQPETVNPELVRPQTAKRKPAKPVAVPRETIKPEATRPVTVTPESVRQKQVKPEVSRTARPAKSLVRPIATDEQGSYQQAKLAYLKGDYQTALELFTQFRSKYPASTFSADVALYQADCLLHLSGE